MQITVELQSLSLYQREALAGFILTFPTSDQIIETLHSEPALDPAIETLKSVGIHSEPALDPAVAFGPFMNSIQATAPIINQIIPASLAVSPTIPHPPPPAGPHLVIPQAPELDKTGIPWDERIHASGRSRNADQTWRKKRGVSPDEVSKVEAELRQLMAVPAAPPPTPGQTEGSIEEYIALIGRASGAISNGKLQQHQLSAICAFAGVGSLQLLATRLDLLPQVAAEIDKLIASQG